MVFFEFGELILQIQIPICSLSIHHPREGTPPTSNIFMDSPGCKADGPQGAPEAILPSYFKEEARRKGMDVKVVVAVAVVVSQAKRIGM